MWPKGEKWRWAGWRQAWEPSGGDPARNAHQARGAGYQAEAGRQERALQAPQRGAHLEGLQEAVVAAVVVSGCQLTKSILQDRVKSLSGFQENLVASVHTPFGENSDFLWCFMQPAAYQQLAAFSHF